jgi:opacity protein-like surface antigen
MPKWAAIPHHRYRLENLCRTLRGEVTYDRAFGVEVRSEIIRKSWRRQHICLPRLRDRVAPMTIRAKLLVGLSAFLAVTRVVVAGTDMPWDGVYAGLNAGTSHNPACKGGEFKGAVLDPTGATALENPPCSGKSGFVGGIQFGEDVQYRHFLVGLGVDFNSASAEKASVSRQTLSGALPAGTYAFSGRFSPARFAVIAPRIGYVTLQCLAYVKAGALVAGGSPDSTLYYVAPGAKSPSASFGGGNTFATIGWAAGGGIEYGLNGPWSITAEYLRESLGKGSDSMTIAVVRPVRALLSQGLPSTAITAISPPTAYASALIIGSGTGDSDW